MWSKCVFAILASLTLIGIGFVVNAPRQTDVPSLTTPAENLASIADPQTSSDGPVRAVRFTLFEAGIRPAEMRIRAGWVNLLVEDRTNGTSDVALQQVLANERVAVGRIVKNAIRPRGRNAFRLGPGKYQLYDTSRPDNTAVLLVEP